MERFNWEKPEMQELGSAKDIIQGLGAGKEGGPTDNQFDNLNVQFS